MKKNLPVNFLKQNLLFIFLFFCSVQSAFANRIYVNAASVAANPDGLKWSTAYPSLETALSVSYIGDEIWVVKGTYQPTAGGSFHMKDRVAIYGGFIGSETSLAERSFKNNITILKGNGNTVVENIFTDYDLGPGSILDGFTIQDGSSPQSNYGGGICNIYSSPTLRNLIIKNNTSHKYGGGIALQYSSSLIENVTIDHNTAAFLGGGISIESQSAPTFINVVVSNNESTAGMSGGMDLYESTVTLNGVVFALNKAANSGGGLGYESETAPPIFNNVVFYKNTAADGAGISASGSDATLTNVTFAQNIASNSGGAVYYFDGGTGKKPTIVNSVFWGNTAISGTDIEANLLSINYSYTQTNFTTGTTGNITGAVSPFKNENLPTGADGIWLTNDDGLQLGMSAAAKNSGSNSAASTLTTDATGNKRVSETTVDMGAYEAQLNNDTKLTGLSTSVGTIFPAFDATVRDYSFRVDAAIASLTVTTTFNNVTAKIKGTDNSLTPLMSGVASGAINLAMGVNTIEVQVTAEDGTTVKTYTLTVTRGKSAQTISLTPIGNKTYNAFIYPTATGGGSGNRITYTSSNTAIAKVETDPDLGDNISFVGVGSVTITANQAGDTNYFAADPVSETVTVSKAIPRINFAAVDPKPVNAAWGFYVATKRQYIGNNNVYLTSSNPDVVSVSGINYQIRGVGTAIITAHLDGDANYENAVDVSQTQIIYAADQTITFNTLADKTYGDAPFNLTATGGDSGNPITYVSSNTAVATINGNQVTILAQGTTSITASQAGNTNYNAATDVVKQLLIKKAPLTYAATPVTVPFGFAIPALTGNINGLANGESLATAATGTAIFTTTAVNGSAVGSYEITGSGLTATDNYTLAQATGNITALTIVSNDPIVTTTSPATSITPTTATLTGNASGDGGYPITEKGIVYGTATNPTIATATTITNGSGIGPISVTLSALTPATTYYFRTYATNATSTVYGANVTFTTPYETPSVQASAIVTANTTTTGKTISWTNGNGSKRAVFISATLIGSPVIVNGINYTANTSFSGGSNITGSPSGTWKCVYNGTGSTVTVTNLTSNKEYKVIVFEYNGTAAANYVYNTSTLATNNPVTFSTPLPIPAPALSGVSATAISSDWIPVTDADNYQYDVSLSNTFATTLADYTNVTTTSTRISLSGLLPSTIYYIRVRSVNDLGLASANSTPLMVTTLAEPRFEATYDFASVITGSLPSKTDLTPVPLPYTDGLTFSAIKFAGTSTTSATVSQFGFSSWPTAAAISTTTYDEVTITPTAGYNLTISSLTFAVTRNSSGPTKYVVRSSVDGYTTNLTASAATNPSASGNIFSINSGSTAKLTGSTITPGTSHANLTGAVTIRIYAYSATNTSTGTFTIDDVKFTGTLTGPPVNAATYPKTTDVTTSTIKLINSLDKTGTTYYVAIPNGGTAPTTVAQVLAGTDGNNDAAKAGSFSITPSTPTTTTITGLTAATEYKIYVVSKDASATPIVQSAFTTLTATTADKAAATLTLSNLTATYDGTAKAATVTTDPIGLSGVTITYAGSSVVPSEVGSYAVVAKLVNNDYAATDATGSLVIGKAAATLTLSNLTATYDGTAKAATVTTDPIGLSGVTITYAGSSVVPSEVGSYAVVAKLVNNDYIATDATGSLVISKATATLSLSNLTATYDGTAKSATVTTDPAGLSGVSVTYDGSATAPTAVGTYAVVASLNNANYTGTASGSLVIGKATATLTLSNLSANYDGTAKSATVTTDPAGLSGVSVTYDGSATAPTAAGTYAVVASLNNANYTGTTSGSLVIGKASQTITFATFANKNINSIDFVPGATVNTALALTYTSSNTAVATVYQDMLDGNKWKIHILAEGITDITAIQAGNSNYNSQSLARTLIISPVTLPVSLTSFTAKIEGNRGRLDWTTASEQQNEHFEIERSTDGKNFTYLGSVKGNGTTSIAHSYSLYDYNPVNGINYYRLKQYDMDGNIKTYDDKSLNFSFSASISVKAFPNPTTDKVNLSFKNYNGNEAKVVITDIMGRTIYTETIRLIAGTDSYGLKLNSKLLPGQYVISVTGTGLGTSIKLIAL